MKKLFKDLVDPEPLQKYFPGVLEALKLDFSEIPNKQPLRGKLDNLKDIETLCKRYEYKGNPHNLLLINIYLWLSNNDRHTFLQKKERDHIKAVKDLCLFTNNISDFKDIDKIKITSCLESLEIKDKQLLSEIYNAIKPVLTKYENVNLGTFADKSSGYQNFIKAVTKSYFNYIRRTSQMTGEQSVWFISEQPGNFLGSPEAITKRLGRLLDK